MVRRLFAMQFPQFAIEAAQVLPRTSPPTYLATTGQLPRSGQQCGADCSLDRVACDERREAERQRLARSDMQVKGQPGDADDVDRDLSEQHRGQCPDDLAICAALSDEAAEVRGEDETDQVAEVHPDVAVSTAGEPRQADDAQQVVDRMPAAPRFEPRAQPVTSTPSVWPVIGTGVPGMWIEICASEAGQSSGKQDEQDVFDPQPGHEVRKDEGSAGRYEVGGHDALLRFCRSSSGGVTVIALGVGHILCGRCATGRERYAHLDVGRG